MNHAADLYDSLGSRGVAVHNRNITAGLNQSDRQILRFTRQIRKLPVFGGKLHTHLYIDSHMYR